jgi:UDPglucose 6-dehydrogenase/GDP-mannose 6-dehydrogenase
MRESPAIPIVQELLAEGASINAYDPVARHEATKIFGANQIHYCDTLAEAIRDVKGILLLTRWQEFNDLPKMINKLDLQPIVIDGRRMLEKTSVDKYDGIGLGLA